MPVCEKDHGPIACRTLPSSLQDASVSSVVRKVIWPRLEWVGRAFLLAMGITAADFDGSTSCGTVFPVAMEFTLLGD